MTGGDPARAGLGSNLLLPMEGLELEEITYRKARVGDAAVLAPMVRELAGDASDEQIRRRLRRMILRPGYLAYVLVHQEKPIALALFRPGLFLGADAPYLQVLGLVVDPAYRGHGISAHFMSLLGQESTRQGYCQLWFITQHDYLHQFYESLGFVKTGTRFVIHTPASGRTGLLRRIGRKLRL